MKKTNLRILSALLCLAMLLSGLPALSEEAAVEIAPAEIIEVQPQAEVRGEAPAENSGEAPKDAPAENSGETPKDAPAEESGEASGNAPTENPGEAPEDAPTENPGEAPDDAPTEEPDEAVTDSVEDALAAEQAAQLDEAVLQWIAALNGQGLSGDYARALWLYDRLIANVNPGADSTAHAALVMGSANATGYALALEALMNAAGLECRSVETESGAWNVALLDGEWTHIDAYMDDSGDSFGRHFALTDGAMRRDHSLTNPELPACTGTANNYYVRSQGYLAYDGEASLRALLVAGVEAQADALKLYNAGAEIDALEDKINAMLAELAPATATVLRDDFLSTVQIHYGVTEAAPMVAAAPAAPVLPESIVPASQSLTLGVKEQASVADWTLLPEGAQDSVTYTSKSTRIASVSAEGVVTAKKAGSTTITIKAASGASCTVNVTVKKAPTSVSITGDRKVLGVGETMQLGYKLSSGSVGSVIFSCAGDSATVTPDGLLTAVKSGTATVTVATFNGKKKSATIEVKPAPTAVTLEAEQLSMAAGTKRTLGASLNVGSAGLIRFRCENPEIAAIDEETGEITARTRGTARIVAYTYVPGVEARATLEVVPAPTYVSLPYQTLNIGVGDALKLQPEIDPGCATVFSYSSSSSKYVKVRADGTIQGARTGKATVTIKTHNGLSFKLTVNVQKAPTSVKASPAEMKLGVGETMLLEAVLPSNSATTLRFESKNPGVATVDESGLVKAVAAGEAILALTTHNGKSAQCKVTVFPAPKSVFFSLPDVMGVGQKASPVISLTPADSHSNLNLSVISGDAVEIDNSGNVSAVRAGKAVVRAATHVQGVYADREILVKPAPKSVSFPQESYTVNMGETLQLQPVVDAGAYAELSYKIQKAGFFTIDERGLVTPVKRGSSAVKVTTQNGLSATTTVWVVDPNYPELIELAETPPEYMEPGETYTPKIRVFPESAISGLVWTSSDDEIASVNAETGKVTAHSFGRTVITGKSSRNPELTLSYKLIVLSNSRCLKMPARRTSISEISATQAQIKSVRSSAYQELESLYTRGVISKSEMNTRHGYVERAFDMYLMPWMTETKELYWKAANSENGAKDFKPGIVYHGMPYTQTNRVNSKGSAVSKGYYTSTGKGYYLLNGSKFSSRNYPGNDCSSFASIAIWGIDSGRASNNTTAIGSASYYRTLSDWTDLRTGDLLNKSGSHVVMFLYYANKEKTQIVIIEQGGGEAGTNTVSCSIRDVSYYTNKGYKIRRVSSLAY